MISQRRFPLVILAGALTLGIIGLAAQASEGESGNLAEEKAQATEVSQGIEVTALADQLAVLTMERGDAAMLVQAIRLKQSVPPHPADITAESGGPPDESHATAQDKDISSLDLTVDALLEQAEVLANGDEMLLTMVSEARDAESQARGREEGPGEVNTSVLARDTDYFPGVRFIGGELAPIWLESRQYPALPGLASQRHHRLIARQTT